MTQVQIESLPFVARKAGRIVSYWSPARTGDYGEDCQTGRRYADMLMQFLRESGKPHVLPWIAQALPDQGQFGGVETGFTARIGEALCGIPGPAI